MSEKSNELLSFHFKFINDVSFLSCEITVNLAINKTILQKFVISKTFIFTYQIMLLRTLRELCLIYLQ